MIDAAKFNRAMTLWFELTGMDPNASSFRLSQLNVRSMSLSIKEAIGLDPSLITSFLLLDAFSTSYFKEAKVSVSEFDSDPDKVFEYMDKVREFKALIKAPEICREADRFTDALRRSLLSYGVEAEKINTLMDRRHDIAFLRRDALLSASRLRADHFLKGDQEPHDATPVYHKNIYGYWSINNLINHACQLPSGVSINLIRDDEELHSYFIFAIRNGGNVITLTDMTEYTHPLGRYMTRRPDRTYDARVAQNWFPYQFLQIAFNEKGEAYHDIWRESTASDLVAHQQTHFTLSRFLDMSIEQIAWTSLMFDQIVERYWRRPIEAKALSYTNEMIRLTSGENPLLGAAASAQLPISPYDAPTLPRLSVADIRSDSIDPSTIGVMRGDASHNAWLEDRYAHLVPDEVLNIIGMPTKAAGTLCLEGKAKAGHFSSFSGNREPVPYEGPIKRAYPDSFGHIRSQNKIYPLKRVDATMFGPIEQLDADRKFIARHNYATAIQMAADNEFAEREDEIKAWYKERVLHNRDALLAFVHHESTWVTIDEAPDDRDPRYIRHQFSHLHDEERAPKIPDPHDRRRMITADKYYFGSGSMSQVSLYSGDFRGGTKCFVNPGMASKLELYIQPKRVEDLCYLAGVDAGDLPDVLQHWKTKSHQGNQILDRIDPLEWALRSPWDKLNFGVRIYLSRLAVNALKKRLPPPPVQYAPHLRNL